MQTLIKPDNIIDVLKHQETVLPTKEFIVANTIDTHLDELKNNHIIPVFIKDNEPLISQADFVETTNDIIHYSFQNELISTPSIRISHPIKGRIPEARNKPAQDLSDEEKTIYYERMAFAIEIPSISNIIAGNQLNLTIGGIKCYNTDNLYGKKGTDEHFKFFIGFENKVCTNMCIWTDGFSSEITVRSHTELTDRLMDIIINYNAEKHLEQIERFTHYSIDEDQFAYLLGKCRMYNYLSKSFKNKLPLLLFSDTQIGIVARNYFMDKSFHRDKDGKISLWNIYNLFTGANKSSYIDTFFDRGYNAFTFINHIADSLDNPLKQNWFINDRL